MSRTSCDTASRWLAVLSLYFMALANSAVAAEVGEPLRAALAELSRAGLQLVYSSALVPEGLTVTTEVRGGTLEQQAMRLLQPHGLTLEPVRAGVFVVVRRSSSGQDTAQLQVAVTTANGEPAPGAVVTLSPGARRQVTGADGQVGFSALPPGRYSIDARLPGAGPAGLAAIELRPAESLLSVVQLSPPSEPLVEVNVFASRYTLDLRSQMSLSEYTREDLEALPNLREDALRALQFLPGIAATGLSSRVHVRGGRDNELAVLFDGVPLFEPFHFKDFHGILGSVDPALIGGMDFYSGVAPARFGDRLSGVLDLTPRSVEQDLFGEVGVSLLYAHALAGGRIGERGPRWLASVRQSTVHGVLDLSGSRFGEPEFLDAFARVNLPLGERGELVAGMLSLDDSLTGSLNEGTEQTRANYRDNTVWLRGHYEFESGAVLRALASHSDRHTERRGSIGQPGRVVGSLSDAREFDNSAARFELQLPPRARSAFLLGLEWAHHDADYRVQRNIAIDPRLAAGLGRSATLAEAATTTLDGDQAALYASLALQPSSRWRFDLGLRMDQQDYSTVGHARQISPRVGLEYAWRPDTRLRLSWGHSAQAERPDELQSADGETGLHAAQRATQTVLGLEHRLTDDATLRIESYNKRVNHVLPTYENLFDPFALLPELEPDRTQIAPLSTRIYGVEVSGRWQPRRAWSGWMSYSWSEAKDDFGGFEAPRSWHQPTALLLGGSWQQAPWQLSTSVGWHSGWRRTPLTLTTTAAGARILRQSPRNSAHWGDFLSLDLKAAWSRPLPHGSLKVYAEVTNSTNRNNVCCVRYTVLDTAGGIALQQRESRSLPIFPLIGFIWQLP
jgi:outer membrane receptor protein involved in Fe transport